MKQNIDLIQLNELSSKGRDRLFGWYRGKEEYGDKFTRDGKEYIYCEEYALEMSYLDTDSSKPYPLLSAFQMIEFLDKHHSKDESKLNWWESLFGTALGDFGDPEVIAAKNC